MDPYLVSSWYDNFKPISIECSIINMPEELYMFLTQKKFKFPNLIDGIDNSSDSSDSDCDNNYITSLPPFYNIISDNIKKLGGQIFPKVNYKAPIDGKWINFDQSLKCSSIEDILLILKASCIIPYILNHPNKQNEIIFKKWVDINPAYEFRGFVKDKNLIGISQRDISHLYEYIREEYIDICEEILIFFKTNIKENFPADSYSFDVYREKNNIVLIDMNPITKDTTSTLLFEWEELNASDLKKLKGSYIHKSELAEFSIRYIQESYGIQPNKTRYMAYPNELYNFDNINI